MGAWSLTTPVDETTPANALHTVIQTFRADVMERMRATNADADDEHSVYGTGATGKHTISAVGFCGVWTTYAALSAAIAAANAPDGSLHYVSEAGYVGLYIVRSGVPELVGSADHGMLDGLDDDDHTQFMLVDGSRAATGTIKINGTLSVTTYGTDDDNPVEDTHADATWYAGHGAGGIILRHFADDSVALGGLNYTTDNGSRVVSEGIYLSISESDTMFWPGFQDSSVGGSMPGDRNQTFIAIMAGEWVISVRNVGGTLSAPGYELHSSSVMV